MLVVAVLKIKMPDARMPTDIWIQAHVARLSSKGVPVVVLKRGDKNSGIIIVKINRIETGVDIFMQERDLSGNFIWQPALDGRRVEEPEAASFIERQAKYDPDIWIVEIEDREDHNLLEILEM